MFESQANLISPRAGGHHIAMCPMATATEPRAQRIAGGFAAPADFAALHADRIEAVCRMQAAEGRELTRVWEIGHELKEVRSLALTTRPSLVGSRPWPSALGHGHLLTAAKASSPQIHLP